MTYKTSSKKVVVLAISALALSISLFNLLTSALCSPVKRSKALFSSSVLVSISTITLLMASMRTSKGFPAFAVNKAKLIIILLQDFLFSYNFSIFLMVANEGALD
jgi:hypothetical protein